MFKFNMTINQNGKHIEEIVKELKSYQISSTLGYRMIYIYFVTFHFYFPF